MTTSTTPATGSGFDCFCCQAPLPADRKLICDDCLNRSGAVAKAARMLRSKYQAAQ